MSRYVIDLEKLEATAKIARANADRLGVHLLMALKSFPLPAALPTLAKYVEGFTCSGLYEAKLVNSSIRRFVDSSNPEIPESSKCRFVESSNPQIPESTNRRIDKSKNLSVHVHAPAYMEEEIGEVIGTSTHVVFNSIAQLEKFGPAAKAAGKSVGLRINPGFSSADCLAYDPCCPDSRFGVLFSELEEWLESTNRRIDESTNLIDGLHIHALCEGYADQFAELVERFTVQLSALSTKYSALCTHLKWVNLGGGEVINNPAFASPRAIAAVAKLQSFLDHASCFMLHASLGKSSPQAKIYLEPSEYLVRYSGSLEAKVLDVLHREKDIAILDVSASCHATDLLLFKMTPDVIYPPLVDSSTCRFVDLSNSRIPESPHSRIDEFPNSRIDESTNRRIDEFPNRRTILGAVSCLAGDVFGEYEFAEPLKAGDTVVFGGLGSYSFAQLSWFNGIRHPDIVLKRGVEERVIRHWDYRDFEREFAPGPR